MTTSDLTHNESRPFENKPSFSIIGSHGGGSCFWHSLCRAAYRTKVPTHPMTDAQAEAARKSGMHFDRLYHLLGESKGHYSLLNKAEQQRVGVRLRKFVLDSGTHGFCTNFALFLQDVAESEQTPNLVQQQTSVCPAVQERLKEPKLWANVHSIAYSGWLLKIGMLFYDSVAQRLYCGATRKYARYAMLYWKEHRHFEGMRYQKSKYVFKKDDPVILDFLEEYGARCHTVKHAHIML